MGSPLREVASCKFVDVLNGVRDSDYGREIVVGGVGSVSDDGRSTFG